jgi:3'-phosphoadenosine 5'-phosphosulfate sulfotransferase (PAPS reductase)/FAD synthetase
MADSDGDEQGDYRIQAPKRSVGAPGNPPGKIHPDWFWAMSGGIDSVAAYLLTRDALHENYGKRPVMLYWDTRIGLPLNRLYLEEVADTYDEQLWPLRTQEKFEDRVARRGKFADRDDTGPPGGGQHDPVRNELKRRQASRLMSLAPLPVVVLGLRADESDTRAEMEKVEQKDGFTEVRPVHRLSKRDCARIILKHEECPINPCWVFRHPSDCFCLANGDPSELKRAEERFPWFTQRIREYEEAAEAVDGEEWKEVLGWDGLRAVERDAKQQGQEQTKLSTCGGGCQREQDPRITRAFRAVLDGATREEAIGILDARQEPGMVV